MTKPHKIFYAHFPFKTETIPSRKMDGSTRYRKGVITAAMQELTGNDSVENDERVFTVGFSFCAPTDSWNRKKGNMIAENRRRVARNFADTLRLPASSKGADLKSTLKKYLREHRESLPVWAQMYSVEDFDLAIAE